MVCSRGKASPDEHTKLWLFADSGGFCQKPDCTRQLFLDLEGSPIHIAEIAHIIAAADHGPRANADLTPGERGHYNNLILLCPTCHTIVDKAPEIFAESIVLKWKREHKERLNQLFGVILYKERKHLRSGIIPILMQNKAIFDTYGPELDHKMDPESDMAQIWKRKVLASIIPNNRRILAILDGNRSLLGPKELFALEEYRQHVDDLAARHVSLGPNFGGGRQYPPAISTIAEGEAN